MIKKTLQVRELQLGDYGFVTMRILFKIHLDLWTIVHMKILNQTFCLS